MKTVISRNASYWKYRLTHERCAHQTTRKLHTQEKRDLLKTIDVQRRFLAKLSNLLYHFT